MSKTYRIQISEQQRLELIKVLGRDNGHRETDDDYPLSFWIGMLMDLADENDPDMLHGFNL